MASPPSRFSDRILPSSFDWPTISRWTVLDIGTVAVVVCLGIFFAKSISLEFVFPWFGIVFFLCSLALVSVIAIPFCVNDAFLLSPNEPFLGLHWILTRVPPVGALVMSISLTYLYVILLVKG